MVKEAFALMESVLPNVSHLIKIVCLTKFANKEFVRGFAAATISVEIVKFVLIGCALKAVLVMLNVQALKSVIKINVEILAWIDRLVENVLHAKFSTMKFNVLVPLDLLVTHLPVVSPTVSGVPNPKQPPETDFQAFWPRNATVTTPFVMLENFALTVSA